MGGREDDYATGSLVRLACRRGEITGCTSGLAPGYEQANVTVLPQDLAYPFLVYCIRNPQPCPLLDVTDAGCSSLPSVAKEGDIRRDLPRYYVHQGTEKVEKSEIVDEWRHDSVAVLLGCSFTFEDALEREGIPMRHIEEGVAIPMYITNRQTVPSGPFHGPLVVSMRPIDTALVSKAISITEKFPRSHGPPVQIGDPSAIGIQDLHQPDFGDAVTVHAHEVPVFWACGVTALLAVQNASPKMWMSHVPGSMLVTDLRSEIPCNL